MGGYVLSSTVTRGVHVHHSSAGTWFMTPDTCLPQPHHVVLSASLVSWCCCGCVESPGDSGDRGGNVLHVSHAAFLHMLAAKDGLVLECEDEG